MFGRVDFREDEKKKKKKWREREKKKKKRWENNLDDVWLGEGDGKIMVGFVCFLPWLTKKFSL